MKNATLVIASRFCGPPQSGNGGYTAGMIARLSPKPLRVRLRQPPPLDTPLQIVQDSDERIEVRHQDALVAEAEAHSFTLDIPAAPSYAEALNASRHYVGFEHHPFPTCFVCGPQRSRGDGLRIFPGLYGDSGLVIAPWMPDDSLVADDDKVRDEFMWAALDCPGWFAATNEARTMLLGQIAAQVDRRVHVDESCVVVGWKISSEGRKHVVGTALYDDDGEVCARAIATWIEPVTR